MNAAPAPVFFFHPFFHPLRAPRRRRGRGRRKKRMALPPSYEHLRKEGKRKRPTGLEQLGGIPRRKYREIEKLLPPTLACIIRTSYSQIPIEFFSNKHTIGKTYTYSPTRCVFECSETCTSSPHAILFGFDAGKRRPPLPLCVVKQSGRRTEV